jgi:hypothetical protein
VAAVATWIGGMIDARMWGDKNTDPHWLKFFTDYIWLGGWNVYQPLAWFTVGFLSGFSAETLSIIFYYYGMILWALFGLSFIWDLTYFKIESNVWVRPIRLWAKIGIPFFKIENRTFNSIFSIEDSALVIGFNTTETMIQFNLFRILIAASYLVFIFMM